MRNQNGKTYLNDRIKWRVNRYAPESFRLWIKLGGKDIPVQLPQPVMSKVGYMAVCGKEKEVLDELKRFFRQYSTLSPNVPHGVLGVLTADGGMLTLCTPYGGWSCGQYDIRGKLLSFKMIKEAFAKQRFAVTVKTGVMTNYGEIVQEKSEPVACDLGKRVRVFWPQ